MKLVARVQLETWETEPIDQAIQLLSMMPDGLIESLAAELPFVIAPGALDEQEAWDLNAFGRKAGHSSKANVSKGAGFDEATLRSGLVILMALRAHCLEIERNPSSWAVPPLDRDLARRARQYIDRYIEPGIETLSNSVSLIDSTSHDCGNTA